MDELLRLDGNAAAGPLQEMFSFEVTTARYTCEGCGRTGTLGAAMVYEVREMGLVVRCPGCEASLIRLSQTGGRRNVDLRGLRHLTTGYPGG